MTSLVPNIRFRKESFGGIAYDNVTEDYYKINKTTYELLSYLDEKACLSQFVTSEDISANGELTQAVNVLKKAGLVKQLDVQPSLYRSLNHSVSTDTDTLTGPIIVELYPILHCNIRCKFCYVGEEVESPSMSPLELSDIDKLVDSLRNAGIFNVTILGGEPFLYRHLDYLIVTLFEAGIDISISTNGSLYSEPLLDLLKRYGVKVNVAIHGPSPNVHDLLVRKKGAFEKALNMSKAIRKHLIPLHITAVVTHENLQTLKEIVHLAKLELDAAALTLNYPVESSYTIKNKMVIQPSVFWDAYLNSRDEGEKLGLDVDYNWHYGVVFEKRADLYTPQNKLSDYLYGDKAGRWALEIMPNGDLYPSSDFFGLKNWKIGNAIDDELKAIWHTSEILARIRSSTLPKACTDCTFFKVCRGGLLSQRSLYGSSETPPFGCPIIQS